MQINYKVPEYKIRFQESNELNEDIKEKVLKKVCLSPILLRDKRK